MLTKVREVFLNLVVGDTNYNYPSTFIAYNWKLFTSIICILKLPSFEWKEKRALERDKIHVEISSF